MGLMHVPVIVRAPNQPNREFPVAYSASFLVDTGAIDSMAPTSALLKAGIQAVGSERYELADGSVREYAFGVAQIEVMGKITGGRVIFGPEDLEPILGATALESAGITIDPANQTLKQLPAISLK